MAEPPKPQDTAQLTVKQDNELINASYKLGLDAKRLLLLGMAKISDKPDLWRQQEHTVRVTADEWIAHYGSDRANVYRQMREALDDLYAADIVLVNNGQRQHSFRWINERQYHGGQGWLELTFTRRVLLYTSKLVTAFTSLQLLNVGGLRSWYSIRTYELIAQFRGTGWRHISIADYRAALGMDAAVYPRFADLKRRVLDHACEEISAKSNLLVSYELRRRGKAVEAIRFSCQDKEQLGLFE